MAGPLTFHAARQLFSKGLSTPVKVLSICQESVAQNNKTLNCVTQDFGESAKAEAKKSEFRWMNGTMLSQIDGMPICIKENYCTLEGYTTDCSKALDTYKSPIESTVTRHLAEAGALFVGKVNMDEFAMGSANSFTYKGQCYNPWGTPEHPLVPGGSSGGSASSVASGMCYAALGSDTGGSIRQPAAFCGIVGFKPTYGSVSRYGIVSLASSLDTPGVLARDAIDVAMVYDVMNQPDSRDSICATKEEREDAIKRYNLDPSTCYEKCQKMRNYRGLTIGLPKEFITEELTPVCRENWQLGIDIAKSLGANFVEVSIPHLRYSLPIYNIFCGAEAASNLAKIDGIRFGYREDQKGMKDFKEFIKTNRSNSFGPEVQKRILVGTEAVSARGYKQYFEPACEMREIIREEVNSLFDSGVDLLMMPTTPMNPFHPEAKMSSVEMYMADVFTIPASITGIPAISVPIRIHEKMPQSLQIAGRQFNDNLVVAAGHLLQEVSGYRLPPKLPL